MWGTLWTPSTSIFAVLVSDLSDLLHWNYHAEDVADACYGHYLGLVIDGLLEFAKVQHAFRSGSYNAHLASIPVAYPKPGDESGMVFNDRRYDFVILLPVNAVGNQVYAFSRVTEYCDILRTRGVDEPRHLLVSLLIF